MKSMSHPPEALHIPDTQSGRDERHLAIQQVGIKRVRYPLQLRIGAAAQPTVALWSLDVALPAEQKGTHMSRFVAWLDALDGPLDAAGLRRAGAAMLERLHARQGRIEAAFPFFLRKRAPVSGVESQLEYQGCWIADVGVDDATTIWPFCPLDRRANPPPPWPRPISPTPPSLTCWSCRSRLRLRSRTASSTATSSGAPDTARPSSCSG